MRHIVRPAVFAAALVALVSPVSAQTLGSAASMQRITSQGGGQTGSSDGTIGYGIKGGLTFASIGISCDASCRAEYDLTAGDLAQENARYSSRQGLTFGVFVTRPINDFLGFQAEGLYAQKGFEEQGDCSSLFASSCEGKARTTYIEIPLLARIAPRQGATRPYLVVGPSLSFLVSAKETVVEQYESGRFNILDIVGCRSGAQRSGDTCTFETDIRDEFNTVDFGFVVAGGFERSRLSLEARYTRGLSNLNSDIDDAGSVGNKVFSILAGFRLR